MFNATDQSPALPSAARLPCARPASLHGRAARAALALLCFGASCLASSAARAEEPPPSPYSLPWQLRSVVAATVVRSDTSIGAYSDGKGNHGAALVETLLGSYRATANVAPFVRLALVSNWPLTGTGAAALDNPIIGSNFAFKLSRDFKLAFVACFSIPIGMGGGDTPDPTVVAANKAGINARSNLDNAFFAANDLAVITGLDVAYVGHGLTLQVEASALELFRVRGEAVQKDQYKTNFTSGLHVGYFIVPQLSLGAELRYQRWLSTPAAVAADTTGNLRDSLTAALGVRTHWKLGRVWFRPGVSVALGAHGMLTAQDWVVTQIDLPFVF